MEAKFSVPWNPPVHHSSLLPISLRGSLNWAPILLRGLSLSDSQYYFSDFIAKKFFCFIAKTFLAWFLKTFLPKTFLASLLKTFLPKTFLAWFPKTFLAWFPKTFIASLPKTFLAWLLKTFLLKTFLASLPKKFLPKHSSLDCNWGRFGENLSSDNTPH